MKTILVTAYAVNPYKGSEDGTGWNLLRQIAMRNKVILITRCNNREAIEQYMVEHPEGWHERTEWVYFDLPTWARFWKRGSWGALPYYMLWQMALPRFVKREGLAFDLAHQLNFHNDWLPTHLWRLQKPVVWGPVGHHPKVPAQFLRSFYGRKSLWEDRRKHWIKQSVRRLNPWFRKSTRKVNRILTISNGVQKASRFPAGITRTIPAVGAFLQPERSVSSQGFTILSVGRFVALKGFDLAIEAFQSFLTLIPASERKGIKLCLVGKGPEKERLQRLKEASPFRGQIEFIDWMPQAELMDLYAQSDIFLFPSHEGAGMVVPEALSYGLPVVCFDNAGPGELTHDQCAVRVPYQSYAGSVQAFANGLEALFMNAGLRKKMSHAARKHIKTTLGWNAKGDAIQEVYQSILSA